MNRPILCAIFLGLLCSARDGCAGELKPKDTVIFFPTLGRPLPNGWELEIHGWVFESENHRLLSAVFRRAIGIHEHELSADEKSTLASRAQFFLADNERRRKISIRLGDQTLKLTPSAANGHFTARLRFGSDELRRLGLGDGAAGPLIFQTVSDNQGVHSCAGEVYLLAEEGLSVISDIDDTIKVSQVLDRDALLRNTF